MMNIIQHLSTLQVMLLVFNQGDCMRDGIVGGHVAAPHSRPYMVLIAYTNTPRHWRECDGFLVREDFVMTAAHCKGQKMVVFPGLHNKSEMNQNSHVNATPFAHPDYEGTANDIMLLKLAKNVSLSDHVNLVALPEAENDVPTTDCVVAGWGSMAYDAANISDVLREVNVTIDTSLNCETPSQLCTRGPNGPFKGDSGGPLVCGEVACGVVSICRGNGITWTHYYTRIAHYRPWINKIMNAIL